MLDFITYINNVFCTLNKENKETYVAGDFNNDLLKIDGVTTYQNLYMVTSYGFLPPPYTRVESREDSDSVVAA